MVVQAFPLYVSTTLATLPGAPTVAAQVVSVPLPDETYETGFGAHDTAAEGVALDTVKARGGEVSEGALPVKDAVIEWVAGRSEEVVNVATLLDMLEDPIDVAPSKNVTVPVAPG